MHTTELLVAAPAPGRDYVVLEEVHKSFAPQLRHPERTRVYQGLTLTMEKGEVVGIIGPNGVGKTVLCDLLSGALAVDSGDISIGGKAPGKGVKVGYLHQNYREALFPWLNVLNNICLGPQFAGVKKAQRHAAARRLLEQVGIELDLAAFPYALSGGQQQMVAFVQTLLVDPELLLMDEPFQSLDLENRLVVEDVLLRTLRGGKMTVVLVSHDPAEAVLLADRIVILSKRPPHVAEALTIALPDRRDVFDTPSEPGFTGLVAKVRMAFKEAQ